MAAMKKQYREPPPERQPFANSVGMKVYRWAGKEGSKEKQCKVDVFDPIRESWKRLVSSGDVPSGVCGGATATVLNDMYTYGGYVSGTPYNGLHKLDTMTMRWSYIHPGGAVRPSPKTGCKLVPIPGNRLALFGGYTPKVVKKHKNPLQKNTTTGGTCNELHIFHIAKGEWTAPRSHGDIPLPCSNFSLTAVDDKRAAMFGGTVKDHPRSNQLHIIHWDNLLWVKIPKRAPWPCSRKAHAACCLNFGQPNPQILLSGGVNADGKKLKDLWLLSVNQSRWTQLPDLPSPARDGHVLIAFLLSDILVEVTLFGGSDKKDKKLSHTSILRFERDGDSWNLARFIEPESVGRPIERVQEKMERLGIDPGSPLSGGDNEPRGQPVSPQPNGEKGQVERKVIQQEIFSDGEGDLSVPVGAGSQQSCRIGLDELEFGEPLGEGLYGEVFAGRWKTNDNVKVAIKRCFKDPLNAEILRVLPRHPNIVLYYAMSSSEDATYIVTELVTNGSLFDFIHTEKKDFDEQRAMLWAKQIAAGMEHLHNYSVLHGDLKSCNILIADDMSLKVCDFGVSWKVLNKLEHHDDDAYRWMAPEIMPEDDTVVDRMCDVFSYGCILYELFEKKIPYYGEKNGVFLAEMVLDGERPKISDSTVIPFFIRELMKACWLEEPHQRPTFEKCISILNNESI